MPNLSVSEILVILVVAIVVFGSKKLPELGKNLGRSLKNFKRSLHEPDEIDITPPREDGKKDAKK